MAPPAYVLKSLTHTYQDRPVLNIPHLEIPSGQVLGILGPTGAGKSTLLRLLAGLERPTTGILHYHNPSREPFDLPLAVRRKITLVFQRALLLGGTVRSNVAYGLRLRGERNWSPRVDEILARLDLTNLADRSARTLSGGETQMVALARALVLDPEVLLLDEPTSHLDPARVARVEQVLSELHQQQGTTIVWATHNLFQAKRTAQRIALLLEGRVVEVAPTAAFFATPQSHLTAAFIRGDMIC